MIKKLFIILLLISYPIYGKNIFKEINNDEILLLIGKNYQKTTQIGSSKFKSNFQSTFGLQLPINENEYLGCNIDFYSLIPSNSDSSREYKVRSFVPNYIKYFKKQKKIHFFYGLKIPIQIILYKESGTIDLNDEQFISFGIEPLVGSSINIYKTISFQIIIESMLSYMPTLYHQSANNPEKNKIYNLLTISTGIIF